ncbi:PREDICTED: uncharacterized protein LOC104757728 [Camelina sativa]|uniref:Uncharacterized protein LOC104757728 n=1 Tax=Camelina sativa TaxID=90675 RepID=A0ABM1R6T4_CAMSA|nr:PREDICTED: uncharacterized protein LOC104757728 [Camelina sativa]XP_019094720.1 PREDICTED: uncharacterized protein LOC104757728 [Camelina sativa]XP_019094721.1 PREDICTED: uncharacterized protein LOC104757728 [Camelina sativa]XP_019094722.1 PREDICTED: uncharacterized protein LOC104757728 [Camelina sativa]
MDSFSTLDFSPGTSSLKRNSGDVGWEYGTLYDPKNPDRVKCKLCGKEMGGGVYRIKEHIAHRKGNVSSCPRSTKEDQSKCMKAILEAKNKKRRMNREPDLFGFAVNNEKDRDDDELDENPNIVQGPMDKFMMAVTPEDSLGGETGQEKGNDLVVHQYCARWIYQSGIAFNVVESDSFRLFCEALGRFGPGWVPPSQCELRDTLLKEEEEVITEKLKSLEVERVYNGCSVLIDAWSSGTNKNVVNFCVNSRGGTCFVSSKEVSKESQTGAFIFEYVDKCIQDFGAEKVVQVITDCAENNLAAARMLKEKRPGIFWSACAADTVKLMLEDIVKLPKVSKYIDKAKAVTTFIYGHEKTLAMMRSHIKEKDIVRRGVTKFATTFLTLQSLLENKEQVKFMFVSDEWDRCNESKYVKGRSSYYTCLSPAFWNGVERVVKVLEPLVKVLRMVDGEKKPSMGFVYGELVEAKRSIKAATGNLERYYQPITEIIDEKIKGRLDTPLHLTAYLLNPVYFYNEPTVQLDATLMTGFLKCVGTFYHGEFEKQGNAVNEFKKYEDKLGFFGKPLAIRGFEQNNDEFQPGYWWSTYGTSVPNLFKLAMRILTLTSSSSGCQRNWSTFEEIHKSERNRLDVDQMNSLVYVQFNSKLINKRKSIKEENADVIVDGDDEDVEEWFVELDREGEEHEFIEDGVPAMDHGCFFVYRKQDWTNKLMKQAKKSNRGCLESKIKQS